MKEKENEKKEKQTNLDAVILLLPDTLSFNSVPQLGILDRLLLLELHVRPTNGLYGKSMKKKQKSD